MMRLNKKGQALVEFIIILPIFIFIAFMIFDYGMISYNKVKMENIITDVSKMYKNNENIDEINDFIKNNDYEVNMNLIKENKYTKIILNKDYKFITPGLSSVMKNYNIKIERNIYNE